MTQKQKLAYFEKCIKDLRRKLLIDPKVVLTIRYVSIDEIPDEMASGPPQDLPELVKQEELLVTHLERVLCGEALYRRAVEAGFKHKKFGRLALAACIQNKAQYWNFAFEVYDRMLSVESDADFRALAYTTACHELLHIVCWPAFSYAQSLIKSSCSSDKRLV